MKVDDKTIRKYRSKASVKATLNLLERISVDDLISEGFVVTQGEFEKEIVKKFEGMLVKSKMDKTYMEQNLYRFFVDTARWVKRNNAYREFLDFGYFIYNQLKFSKASTPVVSSYLNLYMETICYFAPIGKLVYGLESNGQLIIKNEIYPFIDVSFYKASKANNFDLFLRDMKKMGYKVETPHDLDVLTHDEQIITNNIITMASFIDEDTDDMIPDKFHLPSNGFHPTRRAYSTKELKDVLSLRRYILPKEGVYIKVFNQLGVSGVLFKEICKNNQIYMLFRLDTRNGKSMYGVYDTKFQTFYSLFTGTSGDMEFGFTIENFVLELYSHMVTDINADNPNAYRVINNVLELAGDENVILMFSLHQSEKKGETRDRIAFDKRKYKEENVNINPFIRKLPLGASASEEAIERARAFGYELKPDETFVRAFTRKGYISIDDK